MKNRYCIFLTFLFFTVIIFQSCTIEKRRYTSGFHVDLYKSKPVKHEDLNVECDPIKTSLGQVENQDSVALSNPIESLAENTVITIDSSYLNHEDAKIAQRLPVSIEKKKVQRMNFLMPRSNSHPIGEVSIGGVEEQGNGGVDSVLSWIAFAFAVLSIAFVILGVAVNGWAGLGYIAMALIAGVLTAVMAIIAKIVTDRKQNPTRWHLWFAIVVGGIWAIITLRVLFDRV